MKGEKHVTNRELEKIHEEGQEAFLAGLPLSRNSSPENWPANPYSGDPRKEPWKSMPQHERDDDNSHLRWKAWCNGWRHAEDLDSIDEQGAGRLELVMGKAIAHKVQRTKKDRMKDGGITSFASVRKGGR